MVEADHFDDDLRTLWDERKVVDGVAATAVGDVWRVAFSPHVR